MDDRRPQASLKGESAPPMWRRGPGISPGTWDYVHRDSIASGYDAFLEQTPLCQLDRRWVIDILRADADASDSPPSNVWVGDFGSGTGRLSLALADAGINVLAIDLSRPMLASLIDKFENRRSTGGKASNVDQTTSEDRDSVGRIETLRANLTTLDAIEDDSLDHGICMFATLGMIRGRENRVSCLRHAARVIRPGGVWCCHVHHRWAALWERGGWRSLWRSATRRDLDLGDSIYAYRGVGEMFMHRYGRRELIADLATAGFTEIRVDRIGVEGDSIVGRGRRAGGFFATARVPVDASSKGSS